MDRQFFRKSSLLFIACVILLALPTVYLLAERPAASGDNPTRVAKRYLTAVYARDYRNAYEWIAAEDRRDKSLIDYLRENSPFSGVALSLTYKLANEIEWQELRSEVHGDRATVHFTVRLPDANAAPLQRLFLDFDPERLASLSRKEIRAVEQGLEGMRKQGSLPMLEGEENVELVRERGGWRVFANWAGAIPIRFRADVKEGLPWKFWPVQETLLAKPGETLQAIYKAKNLSNKPITAKALHLDEPREMAAKYIEIIQCFCFIQETLAPGEEKEFPLVFRINWDAPNDAREFKITYEFYPIDKFPERQAKNPG